MRLEIRDLRNQVESLSPRPIMKPFPLREEETNFFFRSLLSESPVATLLESLGPESDNSRYTFISGFPKRTFTAKGNRLDVDGVLLGEGNPYDLLSEIFSPRRNPGLSDFSTGTFHRSFLENTESGGGGLYGFLSYEAVNDMEPGLGLKEHPQFPKFQFAWMEDGILIDRRTGKSRYFHYGTDRYKLFEDIYKKRNVKSNSISLKYLGQSRTKEDHRKMVEQAKEEIRLGNTFQCQIGFRRSYEVRGENMMLYEALRAINPSPFMFYMAFHNQTLLGASPELLFRLKDGVLESFPLAGTIRRGENEEEDRNLAFQLLSDPKEIAEHNMLVDLHRNDLGRVAKFGTVKVRDSFALKKFSHVQHLSTEISGILRSGKDMFSGLASSFPTGTLSGAPKMESMRIIERIENDPRGPYGGAIGRFGFDGNCSFCIPIRSFFRSGEEGFIRASGGVVYDSVPDSEYQEIQNKMGAVLGAIDEVSK
ncbi:anthranilate synthase component I [Leptospira broomii serovar Hurstbridge str. 5399]|uniref:Anthranilate synthase component I n=1 Tax=Leptospira broomii serovar Hurstbridge str. 5399 TaxID=1049789 RepID=T0EYU9_9LEPT|nr:anthranilate synthase component I family protein [Leptospira broomii]EQA44035.1 anthranilate synthase component I [Leptospira broomii serovar Hurstbridge str. 5399]